MTQISQFKRSVISDTKKKGFSGGRGNWRDEMKLPTELLPPAPFVLMDTGYVDPDPTPDRIEIDPSTGQPKPVSNLYFKGRRHRRILNPKTDKETFRESTCGKGYDKYNPQPCAGCLAMESGDKSVTLSDFFAFSIFHLAFYHSHPIFLEKEGIFLAKEGSGELVMAYDECVGRDCNYCRILKGLPPVSPPGKQFPPYQPQTIGTVFGRRRYLKIGKGHLKHLDSWDTQVSERCGACRSTMTTEGFMCPTCENLLIDMETDPRTEPQIMAAAMGSIPCQTCQRNVFVRASVYCKACEAAGRKFIENTMTSVVLFGGRHGEGTSSQLMLRDFMSFEDFEAARMLENPNFTNYLEGKPIRQYIAEKSVPFDFPEMFKPKSLQDQAKDLELTLPGVNQQGQGYQDYKQQQGASTTSFVPPPQRPNFGR